MSGDRRSLLFSRMAQQQRLRKHSAALALA